MISATAFGGVLDSDRAQAEASVVQASALPILQIAFNSALTAASPTEISAMLSYGTRPLALLIMSPVMASALAKALLERVREYDRAVGSETKTIEDIISASWS
jgi:hypothetical protein